MSQSLAVSAGISLSLYVDRYDFPAEELKVLELWDSIDAFQTSMKLSEGRPIFTFYDGPPFATGLPHYGHILAATIKDTILRYAYQKGFYVERRFGWDCHGLPIEHEIDKKFNITCREDVLKIGIKKYNEECRSIVMRYSNEWESTVKRTGRWIDFKNDFKTMYPTAMETVWWVFKTLFDKGLVYQGFKVMPYSTSLLSPISNFEANLNYKDTQDPSVVVAFPLENDPDVSLLIWTTTPWTLPSNLAIVAHPDFVYVKIKDSASQNVYLLAESRLSILYKDITTESGNYVVLERFLGKDLLGLSYKPLFPYFNNRPNNFIVFNDTYVTDNVGTGLVHCAPGFGEDDQRIALVNGIIKADEPIPCPIDDSGRFSEPVTDYLGVFYKTAEKDIIKQTKDMGRLVSQSTVTHSYPFCWRSDTPLIQRAVPNWFIRVAEHKQRLLDRNAETYWVPEHVKIKKFGTWLENARDWAVSRNRYWGTPIPIWISEDYQEIICIGSIEELERLSGVTGITDLHREYIDDITIPSQRGPSFPPLRRVEEVFDCWFESGSVPYAIQHFPFENKEIFEKNFPADFIAEGIDQTRGWFYTLLVLSTLLFDKPPFKNLIVNGLVLASDGKKMSKRLKNYPEPTVVLDQYGADSLRLYLITSPVVAAEFLRFKEEGLRGILKDVLLPLVNANKFLLDAILLYRNETGSEFQPRDFSGLSLAKMDAWIMSSFQSLIQTVRVEMDAYRLYTVVPAVVKFIETLTNWYVRLNRRRLKGTASCSTFQDRSNALNVLFRVMFQLSILLSPFAPFLAETIYQKLKEFNSFENENSTSDNRSVHFLMFPQVDTSFINKPLEETMVKLQGIIEMGRGIRDAQSISLKIPLADCRILVPSKEDQSALADVLESIQDELNVRSISMSVLGSDSCSSLSYKATPNFSVLGKKFKTEMSNLQKAISEISSEDLANYLTALSISPETAHLNVLSYALTSDEVKVSRVLENPPQGYSGSLSNNTLGIYVLLKTDSIENDPSLQQEGHIRELVNRIQKLRKKAGLAQNSTVLMHVCVAEARLTYWKSSIVEFDEFVRKSLKDTLQAHVQIPTGTVLGQDHVTLAGDDLTLSLISL